MWAVGEAAEHTQHTSSRNKVALIFHSVNRIIMYLYNMHLRMHVNYEGEVL